MKLQSIPLCAALWLSTLPLSLLAGATTINPPALTYTTGSIVNAASYLPGALAPNTIATIFGTNLSFGTAAVSAATMHGDQLPFSMAGTTVYVDGTQSGLYYVSPTQINFLIPNVLHPGTITLQLARDGFSGPPVSITLQDTAPAIFQDTLGNAIATHLDGSLISATTPAARGEWVVLYCVGLGRTIPDALNYTPAATAAPIVEIQQLALTLSGQAVGASQINYAGLTPGFAGLYQINLKIPDASPADPQIVVSIGPNQSAPKIQLFVSAN